MSKRSLVKRIFAPTNIIILCLAIIMGAVIVYIESSYEVATVKDGVQIIKGKTSENENISENEAKKLAIQQFKIMGEDKVSNSNVEISKIRRGEVEFYYVISAENSAEIQIKGGKITRLNSVLID